jgi:DNA polymerase III subunit gamma/tau
MKNKEKPIMQVESNWSVKHRPMDLSEIVGQDAVVSSIKGMVKRNKIPQTIMITGKSGEGKTTLARIIAKLINGFDMSKEIDSYPDITEINASEERGIDSVRALLKQINFLPQQGRFKVFILDEVHQLTPQAADAFLKPLEEPPAHVVWILATNDPTKLKDTLRRRASPIKLNNSTPNDVVPLLERVAKEESVFQPTKKYSKLMQFVANSVGGNPGTSMQVLQALANIDASNPIDVSDKKLLRSTLKDAMRGIDIGVDKVAVAVLIALYKGKESVIKFLADTEDYQALSYQLLDLNSYVIFKNQDVQSWTTYTRSMLSNYMNEKSINPSFDILAIIQAGLVRMRKEIMFSPVDHRHIVLDNIMATLIAVQAVAEKIG